MRCRDPAIDRVAFVWLTRPRALAHPVFGPPFPTAHFEQLFDLAAHRTRIAVERFLAGIKVVGAPAGVDELDHVGSLGEEEQAREAAEAAGARDDLQLKCAQLRGSRRGGRGCCT